MSSRLARVKAQMHEVRKLWKNRRFRERENIRRRNCKQADMVENGSSVKENRYRIHKETPGNPSV